jgi:Glycoside hydrolase family 44
MFSRGAVSSHRAVARVVAAGLLCACIQRTLPPAGPGEGARVSGNASAAAELPPGRNVLSPDGIASFAVTGAASKVALSVVDVQGQPFDKALSVEIKEVGRSPWEVQTTSTTRERVAKGDVLLATFYARVAAEQEFGGGETEFVFELGAEPYTKSVTYAVPLTPEWRQVHVRFRSAGSYDPGQAHVSFRLGYSPETIQIGGVSVQNFGTSVPLSRLPTTEGVDRRLAARPAVVAPVLPVVDAGELPIDVQPGQVIRKISPYVYGLNSQLPADTGATVCRNGGNRGSAYNWETNFSNAGEDYQQQNDQWPCTVMDIPNCNEPAAQYLGFFARNEAASAETVVTVPMLDYAAADKAGPVRPEDRPPSKRFVSARPIKGKPFSDQPDLSDGVVYEDELVHYLVARLGKARDGGLQFYSLDNEPALWPNTHPLLHPERPTYEEVVRRSELTATAIKGVDPSAFVLGGVMFGWAEYQSLGSASDSAKFNAELGTYTDYFLDALKRLEKKQGRRLVDALDIHWYPEARGSQRITEDDASRSTIEERLQAPRSLWDPTYSEKSWIVQQTGKPIRLIPWLLERIDERYPGTRLAVTEYNYGGTTHVSGALAQVDVLGVFGREGVYLATYWGKGSGTGSLPPYIASAFRMYRNYDGKGAKFGDTAVRASSKYPDIASVFAATRADGALTVIVINKHQQNRYTGVLTLANVGQRYARASTFAIDRSGTGVTAGPSVEVQGGSLRYTLAPLSATLFVFQKG